MTTKVNRSSRTFSDLDLDFIKHPVTKDIVSLTNETAIKRSLKNLINTNFFERKFHPEIGTDVRNLLFENVTPLTAVSIEMAIRNTLENFEPRVNILDINVIPRIDENIFDVSITFMVINVENPITINIFLEKLR